MSSAPQHRCYRLARAMLFAGCWVLGAADSQCRESTLTYWAIFSALLSNSEMCICLEGIVAQLLNLAHPPIKAWGRLPHWNLAADGVCPCLTRFEEPTSGLHSRCNLRQWTTKVPFFWKPSLLYFLSLCSLSLTDPAALQCICEHQEKRTRLTSSHLLKPISYVCLWVCFLWTGLQGTDAMRRTVFALALSAEPMSLLPAVHGDRTVNELRVLDSLSTKSQTSFIRETDSSLLSLR